MKLTTENPNTTTKRRAPYIVHYIHDRERFQTQLLCVVEELTVVVLAPPSLSLLSGGFCWVGGAAHSAGSRYKDHQSAHGSLPLQTPLDFYYTIIFG